MKKWLAVLAVGILLLGGLVVSGCDGTVSGEGSGIFAPRYTVSYSAGGGTGSPPSSREVPSGTAITLDQKGSLVKTNSAFNGWSLNGMTYQAGQSYTVTGNVTFTAQWTRSSSVDIRLTTPVPDASNTIGETNKTITVNVANGTPSVVLTATLDTSQSIAPSGADGVTASGSAITVDTGSIATTGGSKPFTLTVSELGQSDITYNVTVTVAEVSVPTADVTFTLTAPVPDGVSYGGANKAFTVNVPVDTSSVVLNATLASGQSIAVSGVDYTAVTPGGTATAPTYNVNIAGGSKTFTLTVSEAGKNDISYTVTVTVAPY